MRALAPFIAGSSRMPYRDFAPFSILGTGLWSTGLILAGYFAAQSLDTVTKDVGKGLFVFAIVVGVLVALYVAFRFLREPENRGGSRPRWRGAGRSGRCWRWAGGCVRSSRSSAGG